MSNMSGKKWLDVAETAAQLSKSEATVRRMIASGKLPAYLFGDRAAARSTSTTLMPGRLVPGSAFV